MAMGARSVDERANPECSGRASWVVAECNGIFRHLADVDASTVRDYQSCSLESTSSGGALETVGD